MPLPKLSDDQVEWVIQQVAAYIDQQRQTYRRRALPLSQNQRVAMRPFFPASSLESARVVVLAGERVSNPSFYTELMKMGFEAQGPSQGSRACSSLSSVQPCRGPFWPVSLGLQAAKPD